MSTADLANYYAQRAAEYDAIYAKSERQDDIKSLAGHLTGLLTGRRVLEVACGTGYWTQFYAPRTESTIATDYNEEMLEVARSRLATQRNVRIQRADAFSLERLPADLNAGFAGFWWSHLKRSRIRSFLEGFHAQLMAGGRVVFVDNRYVEGSSTTISRTDEHGNTYQTRRLADGRTFEVLKNFPSEQEFRSHVSELGCSVSFIQSTYFWCGWYDART